MGLKESRKIEGRAGLLSGTNSTHSRLVSLLKTLTPSERMTAVCRQLRKREAFWRADQALADSTATALQPAPARVSQADETTHARA
jgi:hypothetical protein